MWILVKSLRTTTTTTIITTTIETSRSNSAALPRVADEIICPPGVQQGGTPEVGQLGIPGFASGGEQDPDPPQGFAAFPLADSQDWVMVEMKDWAMAEMKNKVL
jgi:hypothetical protein